MSKELSRFCGHRFSYLNFSRTFNYVVYRYVDCVTGVFEILTAMVLNFQDIWDVTLCRRAKSSRRIKASRHKRLESSTLATVTIATWTVDHC